MHLHYIVWAYERVEPGTGNYADNVVIDLVAIGEGDALTRARGLVDKPNYCIRGIIEHFDTQPCGRV